MIVHKTFTESTTSLTGRATLGNREKLREKVEEFIRRNGINDEDVVNITETAITAGGLFSITVWYRKS